MNALRVIGLVGMALGVFYLVVRVAAGAVALGSGSGRSDSGIGFYVLEVYLALISGLGPLGIVLFEASRLFGFERQRRSNSSANN